MPSDFSGENFQGRSFKGHNLTGANFRKAKIQGTDFTDAILHKADFSHAQAGLQFYSATYLVIGLLLLSVILGLIAVIAGCLAGNNFAQAIFSQDILASGLWGIVPACTIVLIAALVICGIIQRQGLGTTYIVTFLSLIIIGAVAWANYRINDDFSPIVAIALTLTWGGGGIIVQTLFSAVMGVSFATVLGFRASALIGANFGTIFIVVVATKTFNNLVAQLSEMVGFGQAVVFGGLLVVVIGSVLGSWVSWRSLNNNNTDSKTESWIFPIAIAISGMGGTSFRGADLTDANFSHAILKSSDLRNANLTRTNFHLAKKLSLARVDNTILINPKVRDLVVTKRGANKSFRGCNLKGAFLEDADLNDIDLTGALVSEATFAYAELERANLTNVQALNTNFQQTRLTAACIENWNIDENTQLDGVNCDYIYLLNNQRERRPSSGEFAPDEFTKLFQVALNTVDLIFRNGLDLGALSTALNNLKIENPGTNIQIKGIENIGDGVVVVKVEVPSDIDKAKIHSEFNQGYQLALEAIEARYQAELQSKEEQITLYRQHQADLKALMQMLTPKVNKSSDKLVVIKLGDGDLNTGFSVTLQIGKEGEHPHFESNGRLPKAIELSESYSQWQSAYRRSFKTSLRLDIPDTQITNISSREFFGECYASAEILNTTLNNWLNSQTFRPLKEQLLEQLNTSDSIRIILQTEDNQTRKLPFQVWNFFERYSQAEMALGIQAYERVETLSSSLSDDGKVKILAILGNSKGIDIQKDRAILEQLPSVEITFLVEPQRQQLNDKLWSQPWDILFFAGHSTSIADGEAGYIYINQNDILTISQLRNALKKAISQGLQLAIFNSCDGLGLAANLADLQIPQMIVMREPVPDRVAQEFLKNFLTEFSTGKSLYQSVREAREKLQGLEDEFPCASWLPVLSQNPAHIPPTWFELIGE
ncbi:MAG: pentapeptide repeat-containing protein [Cyanobacteria bacterium P01_H01_bin.150]